ncbi:hypothetical protein CBR_g54105 [Chara braunii]|uniref:SET domain-containing protein n=1 Tax=Chara braunii TaxID=69332 RepID=A0A388MBS4_CHABU|nr:hypothetical protein CBR_g54105 [Chara braunii]|eukprot:GBG92010.1 hypothetical protein CBR_g54105 [Chara braunii]
MGGCRIARCRENEAAGLALYAPACDTKIHGVVMAMPSELAITPATVMSDREYGVVYQELLESEQVDERLLVIVFLMVERWRGRKSKWAPYIDLLPATFTVPLYFSEEELKEIEGTVLHSATLSKKKVLHRTYEGVICPVLDALSATGTLARGDDDKSFPAFEDFLWAHCIYLSRSLQFPQPGWRQPMQAQLCEGKGVKKRGGKRENVVGDGRGPIHAAALSGAAEGDKGSTTVRASTAAAIEGSDGATDRGIDRVVHDGGDLTGVVERGGRRLIGVADGGVENSPTEGGSGLIAAEGDGDGGVQTPLHLTSLGVNDGSAGYGWQGDRSECGSIVGKVEHEPLRNLETQEQEQEQEEEEEEEVEEEEEEEGDERVGEGAPLVEGLLPCIDMCNHDRTAKVKWEVDDADGSACGIPHGIYLHTLPEETLEGGEEICISYGDKGNEELLFLYGFVLNDNPNDSLMVHYPLERSELDDLWEWMVVLLQAQLSPVRWHLSLSQLERENGCEHAVSKNGDEECPNSTAGLHVNHSQKLQSVAMAGTEPPSSNKTEEGDTPHVEFEKLCDARTSALGDWSGGERSDDDRSSEEEVKMGEGSASDVSEKKENGFTKINFDEDMLAALRVLSMHKEVLIKAVEAWSENKEGTREDDDMLRARDFVKRICFNGSASSSDRPAMEVLKSLLEERLGDMERGTGTECDDADLLLLLCNLLRRSDAEQQPSRGRQCAEATGKGLGLLNREPLDRAEAIGIMSSEQTTNLELLIGPSSSNVRRHVLYSCVVYRKMQKQLARRFLEAVETILAAKY